MELANTTIKQNYIKQIKALEASVEEATSNEVDYELLNEAQARLDTLAKKYQDNESLGSAVYKLYELQAVIHYFNNNDDDALDFIDQAIEVRGESYARAEKLKKRLQEQSYSETQPNLSNKSAISNSEQDIISTRQAVQRAGLWPLVLGLVSFFAAIGVLTVGISALPFSIILFGLSFYLFFAGWKLDKVNSSDSSTKKLLITNIVVSIFTIWTLLPIFILVSSIIALKLIKKYDGEFYKESKNYDKIMQKTYDYQNEHSIFFYQSPITAAVLCVITLNFYAVYWVYKHWAFIRKSTGENIHPVLRGIFEVFTVYPLMKRIRDGARVHGYKKFKHAGWAAAGFIILLYLSYALGKADTHTTSKAVTYIVLSFLLSCSMAAIVVAVQKAANAHNLAVLGKNYKFKKVFVGEVIMTIIGVLLVVAAIGVTVNSVGKVSVDSLSPEAKDTHSKVESLRSRYNKCSASLKARRGNIDTSNSYEVKSFNSDVGQCNNIRSQLNQTVDKYNRLAGFN